MTDFDRISENLAAVRSRIDEAARRAGRDPQEIRLIAVTKYVDDAAARTLVEAGCFDLAESRPQELWRKVEAIPDTRIRWHLVGHLQRNKVRRTLPLTWLVHSGDNLRLLTEMNDQAQSLKLNTQVLLEVNISGDVTKHGFSPDQLRRDFSQILPLRHLTIRGLMGMASREGDLESAREDFRRLRELRDELRAGCPPDITLNELSMGMSGDFEVAIAEGATMVRIGSALFEGLES